MFVNIRFYIVYRTYYKIMKKTENFRKLYEKQNVIKQINFRT